MVSVLLLLRALCYKLKSSLSAHSSSYETEENYCLLFKVSGLRSGLRSTVSGQRLAVSG